jgi:DNA-binding response OmpR family regulator
MRAEPALSSVPIIFLTSKSEEINRVLGFEMGGDDYVVKPFSSMELLARMKAVLRRRLSAEEETFSSGGLTLHPAGRTATLEGRRLELPPKEFDLLCLFLGKKGRTLTRAFLMDNVWDKEYGTTRTIDTHVKRLRQRLGSLRRCLHTVERVGYRWDDPEGPTA